MAFGIQTLKTKKEKITVLKNQINMHKNDTDFVVSKMKDKKNLFQFSSKGKQFDVDQLINNLLEILKVKNDNNLDMALFQDPDSFVQRQIFHVWTDAETQTDTTYSGKIVSFQNNTFKVIII